MYNYFIDYRYRQENQNALYITYINKGVLLDLILKNEFPGKVFIIVHFFKITFALFSKSYTNFSKKIKFDLLLMIELKKYWLSYIIKTIDVNFCHPFWLKKGIKWDVIFTIY